MLGQGAWWIGLQWMIAILVYGAHASSPASAWQNALFVLVGGATQFLFLCVFEPLADDWFRRPEQRPIDVEGPLLPALVANMNPRTPAGWYATRVAVALTVASLVNHLLDLPNGYWAPMTVAILIRPDPYDTAVRAVGRVIGTVIGAGVTTLLVALLRPDAPQLGLMLLVAIWACFALQRVNYGVFSTCITAYVVLLLSALGLPEPEVAAHRVEATLAGALIAVSIHLAALWSRPRSAG
jgi:uncharacterized membrane protein YccC